MELCLPLRKAECLGWSSQPRCACSRMALEGRCEEARPVTGRGGWARCGQTSVWEGRGQTVSTALADDAERCLVLPGPHLLGAAV